MPTIKEMVAMGLTPDEIERAFLSGLSQEQPASRAIAQKTSVSTQPIVMPPPPTGVMAGFAEDPATKKKIEDYLKKMEGGISSQEDLAKLYAERPSQLDLSPLAALSDSLSGGKLMSAYKKPETPEEAIKAQSAFKELQRKGYDSIVDSLNKQLYNKGYLELLRMQATQGRSDREYERKMSEEAQKDAEAYSKRTENLPSLKYSLDQLDALVAGIPKGGDIPGVGKTGKVPSLFLTDAGSKIRQHAVDAMIAKVYLTSGKTINESEAERLLKSIGMSWDSSDREFLNGYQNLKNSILKEVKQKQAGYRPEGIQLARQRGALTVDDFMSVDEKRKRLEELRAKKAKEAGQ